MVRHHNVGIEAKIAAGSEIPQHIQNHSAFSCGQKGDATLQISSEEENTVPIGNATGANHERIVPRL